jgi:hypothetical protein
MTLLTKEKRSSDWKMTAPTCPPEPDTDLQTITEDETHMDDSHELKLSEKDPSPTLEQGFAFPKPDPMIDKETAPDVGAFEGTESPDAIESNVKVLLSSELPDTTVTTTDFADRNPAELLECNDESEIH